MPATTADPITPETFGPIACMRTKFVGSSSSATLFETRAAIGTAETPAESDGQKEQRLKSLHDGEVHQDEAHGNHDELSETVGHPEQRQNLVSLDERPDVVEVAAVPRKVLVVVAVPVRGKRLPLRTIRLCEIAGHVVRCHALHESSKARIPAKTHDLAAGLAPVTLRVRRETPHREQHRHHQFLHIPHPTLHLFTHHSSLRRQRQRWRL